MAMAQTLLDQIVERRILYLGEFGRTYSWYSKALWGPASSNLSKIREDDVSIDSLVGWQGIASVGIGICSGLAEFVWHTTAQKISMVAAKLESKPMLGPDEGPQVLSFEALDKQFVPMVIQAPIFEEIVFRGLVQPMLTYGIAFCFPQLGAPALLGVSKAALLSLATTAAGFGLAHYRNYEKGGAFPAAMGTVAGVVFGIVREKFGLIASIAAHITANFNTGLLDKYWPEFLEFSWERELRLLPPRDRELRLLQEAVARANAALAQMPQKEANSDRVELERLRSTWTEEIRVLEAN